MTQTESTGRATVIAVAPLVVVNALAVYGQLAYAMEHIAPATWPAPARVALSIGFAAAVESVALYVGWHAHDALLLRSHSTARALRRWSFLIAACVAAMNYAHFALSGMKPTAAAVAFGMLSLLSPWMWGLHSRRAARIQLLKERRVDDAGAEFSSTRKRAFPIRTAKAYRWSIDHNVTDPVEAWNGYHGRTNGQILNRAGVAMIPTVTSSTPPRPPALPSGRTSSRVASWDVEKAVAMLRTDATVQDVMDATGVGAKPLQLLRRCVRFLDEGMDAEAVAARVPCSLSHVQRVKAAMTL